MDRDRRMNCLSSPAWTRSSTSPAVHQRGEQTVTEPAGMDPVLAELSYESIEMLRIFRHSGSFREVALRFGRDERTVSLQLMDVDKAFWSAHQVHILEREARRRAYQLTPAGEIFVSLLEPIGAATRDAIDAAVSGTWQAPAAQARTSGFLTLFANFTAHDFKTRMQHILWDTQAAAELLGPYAPDDVRELLQRIIASSRWMARQTEGLQAASGLAGSLGREPVSTQEVFDESCRMLAAVDQFVNQAAITRDSLPRVAANEILLRLLFQCLLQNACVNGRVGVPVAVHASAELVDGAWHFSIEDNGLSFPEDRIGSLFDPRVQGGQTGTDERGGGADLAFCRAIIEWHDGNIWAESGPEPGATFKFTIPDPR